MKDNYDWNYYKDGVMLKEQWLKENNKWYYLEWSGRILSSEQYDINDKWYLFDGSGAMVEKKGWINLNTGPSFTTGWYYGNGDGTIKVSQWVQLSGKWYYLSDGDYDPIGKMCSGKSYYVDGKIYLFDNNGAIVEKKDGLNYLVMIPGIMEMEQ